MRSLGVVALLALLSAAPVPAKKPPQPLRPGQEPRVCGAEGCRSLGAHEVALEAVIGRRAPPPARFYPLEGLGDPHRGREPFSSLYVPAADAVAIDGDQGRLLWFPLFGPGAEAARRAVAGVEPFAAPAAWPARVSVEGAPVGAPATDSARRGLAPPPDPRGGAAAFLAGAALLVAAACLSSGRRRRGAGRPARRA